MERETLRIGCWAAFWGDTSAALDQLLGEQLDFLVADYLSEITMALLARSRAKDPDGGFVSDAVSVLAPHLETIRKRGIRVVTNAGGLNPAACARAFERAAADAGVSLTVAAVQGDDLIDQLDELHRRGARDIYTDVALPAKPMTMNAYLGARPIAAALGAGADIVVTGRCVDSAVVLGPLLHEFGWSDDQHDLLSAGSLVGHIIECGPQCCGGTFTDWETVPGWDNLGFPIAECRADGTAVITKPAGTGGLVTPATVAEQIVYEIGDPGAYQLPDVSCDWREIQLRQDGLDRVHVSGARGSEPTASYKVSVTNTIGYRCMTTAMFSGVQAAAKARRAGEALITRAARMIAQAGFEPLQESSVEVIGAGDTYGPRGRHDAVSEAVVKIGVRHREKAALEIFAREYAPMALVAQGMTGFFAGRPRVAPAIEVVHLLVEKALAPASFVIDGKATAVPVAAGRERDAAHDASPAGDDGQRDASGDANETVTRSVALRQLAYARSGDKGNLANIGVIARHPEFAPVIRAQVTCERVADYFGHYVRGDVRRWELPGLSALNFVLEEALGGTGGTSTLRYDPQGKALAAMLLEMPVTVPAAWDADGLLVGAAAA